MAVRLRDRPHVTLPLGGQGVNAFDSIGSKVAAVFNAANDAYLVPTLTKGATNAGPAVIATSTKQTLPSLWQASPTTKATLVGVISMAGSAGNFGVGLCDTVRIRRQGATTCALFLSTTAGGDSYSSNFTVPSNAFTIIVQLDLGSTGYTVWVNGVQMISASYSGVLKTSTLQLQLGGNEFSNGGGTSTTLAYAIPGLLTKGERDAIFANPYLIFESDEDVEDYTGGGGTDYPVTQTEAATGTDTTSCLIGYAPSATEAASAGDAAAAAMAAAVAAIEAASASSAEAAVTARLAAITEAATATDTASAAAAGDYTASIAESATAVSAEAAVTAYLASIAEAASASDTASASLPGAFSVSIAEAASAIETVVCAMSALVAINEAAAAADAANWVGAITYTRAPRGSGYPGTRPTTTRGGQTNTARPTMANTRR